MVMKLPDVQDDSNQQPIPPQPVQPLQPQSIVSNPKPEFDHLSLANVLRELSESKNKNIHINLLVNLLNMYLTSLVNASFRLKTAKILKLCKR